MPEQTPPAPDNLPWDLDAAVQAWIAEHLADEMTEDSAFCSIAFSVEASVALRLTDTSALRWTLTDYGTDEFVIVDVAGSVVADAEFSFDRDKIEERIAFRTRCGLTVDPIQPEHGLLAASPIGLVDWKPSVGVWVSFRRDNGAFHLACIYSASDSDGFDVVIEGDKGDFVRRHVL